MTDKVFNIEHIFTGEYSIPIYQRAYAWSDREIETLIDDVYDYYHNGKHLGKNQNYYIGSLVVHKDVEDRESVIDGQQRLTTLSLLILYLQNESDYTHLVEDIDVNLYFESRKKSTDILRQLKKDYKKVIDESNELVDGYRILRKKLKDDKYDEGYFKYLLERVILIKNELPKETDLNHYFEIMNNRGEQLEKHEIVKAHLLGKLNESNHTERKVISEVWNACQRLDKYVQLGFTKKVRTNIFGDKWDDFIPDCFDSLKRAFEPEHEKDHFFSGTVTIDDILAIDKADFEEADRSNEDDDDTGRYHSIINFPNFLLHVLKLFKGDHFNWNEETAITGTKGNEDESETVSLDDKRLVEQFETYIKNEQDVEKFVFLMLKTRYIFDNYVIKTDSINDATDDNSNWSLHKPHKVGSGSREKLSPRNTFGDSNTQEIVIKIQSMFQVTDPRQIYKNFLYGFLQILHDWIDDKDEKTLVKKLIEFANERIIALTGINERSTEMAFTDFPLFDRGTDTPNYLFNFLDFVLWYRQMIEDKGVEMNGIEYKVNAKDFEFMYRNSVEHFYPQHPNQAENHKILESEYLDHFGNLCIMSRRQNSLRSNLMPVAKIKEFSTKRQSLKFELMEQLTKVHDKWEETEIVAHGIAMKKLLAEFVSH